MPLEHVYSTYDWKNNSGTAVYRFCPHCGTGLISELIRHRLRPLCPQCGFIYYRNPYPTVSILMMEQDRVLLGKRMGEPGKGKWALPSGYIEFEDDFISAAVREVKEETGLDVAITAILNVESAFLPPEFHFLCVYLLARVTGGTLGAKDDLEEAQWFPLRGPLPDIAFPPEADLIRAYAAGTLESITVQ